MDDKLIDIGEILYLFKKRIVLILVIVAAFTGFGMFKASKMVPRYQAATKIYVGASENLVDNYTSNEINQYISFMNTFNEFIRVDDFLNTTLQKYKLTQTAGSVKGSLGFSASENAPIFTLSYSSGDKKVAEDVLKAISSEFLLQAKEIFPTTQPKTIDSVKVSTIMPNKKKVIIMMLAIGLILAIGLVLVLDYLDDTISSRKDLEKALDLPILGELPLENEGVKKSKIKKMWWRK